MCELTAEQQRQLEARMAADPGLAQGLAPLLAGRFGADARDLVLCCAVCRGAWRPDGLLTLRRCWP